MPFLALFRSTQPRLFTTGVSLGMVSLLGLVSCSRTVDNFAPRISITSPEGGASKTKVAVIAGYAMDDTGITKLTLNDKPLQRTGGTDKIAYFKINTDLTAGKGQYIIKAYDREGHVGTSTLNLKVDSQKPTLSIKSFERGRGGVLRVTGVATDNVQVAAVLIDGKPATISPQKRVNFQGQTTGLYADIEVRDSAGNKATLRLQR